MIKLKWAEKDRERWHSKKVSKISSTNRLCNLSHDSSYTNTQMITNRDTNSIFWCSIIHLKSSQSGKLSKENLRYVTHKLCFFLHDDNIMPHPRLQIPTNNCRRRNHNHNYHHQPNDDAQKHEVVWTRSNLIR